LRELAENASHASLVEGLNVSVIAKHCKYFYYCCDGTEDRVSTNVRIRGLDVFYKVDATVTSKTVTSYVSEGRFLLDCSLDSSNPYNHKIKNKDSVYLDHILCQLKNAIDNI